MRILIDYLYANQLVGLLAIFVLIAGIAAAYMKAYPFLVVKGASGPGRIIRRSITAVLVLTALFQKRFRDTLSHIGPPLNSHPPEKVLAGVP